jgi:hypothetical protein
MKTFNAFIDEMMAVGTGGFTSDADAKGPVAGYDLPFKGMIMRRWREAADKNKRKDKKNK